MAVSGSSNWKTRCLAAKFVTIVRDRLWTAFRRPGLASPQIHHLSRWFFLATWSRNGLTLSKIYWNRPGLRRLVRINCLIFAVLVECQETRGTHIKRRGFQVAAFGSGEYVPPETAQEL